MEDKSAHKDGDILIGMEDRLRKRTLTAWPLDIGLGRGSCCVSCASLSSSTARLELRGVARGVNRENVAKN
jgi:hypothetical protein